MASLTTRCGLNVVTRLTFCCVAVVAIRTTCRNASMVHCRATKTSGVFMTSLTRSRCLDMATGLTFSGYTVMAIGAARCDASVIHRTGAKRCR